MILKSLLMLVAGFFLLPVGFVIGCDSTRYWIALVPALLLVSMGFALLITGATNLMVGICRVAQSRH